jgi:oligopeptide/dipeptide ABC transporter ATP-binding protein
MLEVRDLQIHIPTNRGLLRAVEGLSFELERGRTLGIVGESGCGKSLTSLALMGLLPSHARVTAQAMRFEGQELLALSEAERRATRGRKIAMIFQDPMTSLNPSFTVRFQLAEVLALSGVTDRVQQERRILSLLTEVGIPDPRSRLDVYPHQLSGGMCQRIMIAIAIAGEPELLIADEPTTALDVTIQAQILELIRSIQKKRNMGLVLITHDLGVVSKMADEILVMYAGEAVERGPARLVLEHPQHPYTQGLLACLPASHAREAPRTRLPTIGGLVPDLVHRPNGCALHPRCLKVEDRCAREPQSLRSLGQSAVRCWKAGHT